jgi:hypothetical protein
MKIYNNKCKYLTIQIKICNNKCKYLTIKIKICNKKYKYLTTGDRIVTKSVFFTLGAGVVIGASHVRSANAFA